MTLIDDLRQMVAASETEWSNTQLDQVLDGNRSLINFQPIEWHPTRTTDGAEYKRGSVNVGLALTPGTAGGTVQTAAGSAVTGWTLSRDGWIEFASDQGGGDLRFTGWAYDLNAAAAEVCDAWAARLKGMVDVTSDDQSLKLSQKVENLKSLARDFRAKAPIKQGALTRGDVV
mgnify:CR=1 FL=1